MITKTVALAGIITSGLLAYGIYTLANKNITIADLNTNPSPDNRLPEYLPDNAEELQNLRKIVTELETTVNDNTNYQRQLEEDIYQLEQTLLAISKQLDSPKMSTNPIELSTQPPNHNSDITLKRDSTKESLLAYGFSDEQIKLLSNQQDQLELDKLYLRDKAIRENWINSPRYTDEHNKLSEENNVRHNLGDDRYDQYLFATGEDNRILIEEVMQGSAAEQIGLQTGDTIISYNDKRIFSWLEIRSATLKGETDEIVSIVIERDKQRHQLSIPRGPLGIRLNMTRVEPNLGY